MRHHVCGDPINNAAAWTIAIEGVVVRWRIADAAVGRLLDRGMCCCNPDPSTSSPYASSAATSAAAKCADSPGWLVRNVQLHIRSVDGADDPVDCTVIAPCTDGELTTQYCFPPGVYDPGNCAPTLRPVASSSVSSFV